MLNKLPPEKAISSVKKDYIGKIGFTLTITKSSRMKYYLSAFQQLNKFLHVSCQIDLSEIEKIFKVILHAPVLLGKLLEDVVPIIMSRQGFLRVRREHLSIRGFNSAGVQNEIYYGNDPDARVYFVTLHSNFLPFLRADLCPKLRSYFHTNWEDSYEDPSEYFEKIDGKYKVDLTKSLEQQYLERQGKLKAVKMLKLFETAGNMEIDN